MGGAGTEQFERFVDCCGHAYNIVRKHGHLLLVLFTLMLSTGIPELRELEDIDYMRQMLSLEMTDERVRILEPVCTTATRCLPYTH